MTNIHLTKTQEKAYLTVMNGRVRFDYTPIFGEPSLRMDAMDMHITINEEPKLDEWGINIDNNVVFKDKGFTSDEYGKLYCKKIIMTTNQELIRAGVQEISIEVLEWFVNNSSCDTVEVQLEEIVVGSYDAKGLKKIYDDIYKIIIFPKEEPKQETLEEAAERLYKKGCNITEKTVLIYRRIFIEGAKWQQERSYSEEEVLDILDIILSEYRDSLKNKTDFYPALRFEKFKK